MAPPPSTWRGRSEQNSLDRVGCEARKTPAEGDVFFLDFFLYRTNQDLSAWFDDEFRAADHPLTDLSGIADHLLESAAKLPREAGLP
jgi:hypothetical protein